MLKADPESLIDRLLPVEANHLNAVEVLIRHERSREDAFNETLAAHNDLVRSLLCLSELDSISESLDGPKRSWTVYI